VILHSQARFAPLVFLAAVLAVAPLLLEGTYYTHLATSVLIYSIAAIGLNIIAGYAGQLSLAQAAFMAIGAYSAAFASKSLDGVPLWLRGGLQPWLGMGVGIILAALAGGVLAIPVLRVRGPYLAMMTLAFAWIVWKILLEWVSVTGGDLGISSIPKAQFGSIELDERGYYFLALALFVAVLFFQNRLISSQFGLVIRAVKYGELAVASAGIDVRRVKFATFVISSAVAGLAGALFAHQQSYINPDSFQVFDSVFILLAVLLGGAGTMLGPVVGTTVLVVLPEMLHEFAKYRLIVYGGILLFALYFLPRGLVGEMLQRAIGRRERGPGKPYVALKSETTQNVFEVRGGSLYIEHVSRSFGKLLALNDVSLRVERGTIHAVIGPNGAGKTTLINVIAGVYPSDGGRVVLDGAQMMSKSLDGAARLGIIRTFQNVKTLGDLSVIEHVLIGFAGKEGLRLGRSLFGSRRRGNEWLRQWDKSRELLSSLGIPHHLQEAPANDLSQGHRRLIEIARAIAAGPRVLLLDEPAAGLVADEVRNMASLLRKLREGGMTIVLVEHNMEFVRSVADIIAVLDHGEVVACGLPKDIVTDERVIASYLGPSDATS